MKRKKKQENQFPCLLGANLTNFNSVWSISWYKRSYLDFKCCKVNRLNIYISFTEIAMVQNQKLQKYDGFDGETETKENYSL